MSLDMPEKRLMLAVLLDAILQLRRLGAGAAEAAAWFRGAGAGSPFSFASVCDSLGLDAGYLIRGVSAWARGDRESPPTLGRLRRPQARALRVSIRRRRRARAVAVA